MDFFERPILNSPYEYPRQHWELDDEGQPTQGLMETRRRASFIFTNAAREETQGQGRAAGRSTV